MSRPLPSPLVLVGFMGCGKSTVGRLLAGRLGWHFCDLDERIELAAGAPINTIFAQQGEGVFRRLEYEALLHALREIGDGRRTVLALGGGTSVQPDNERLLRLAGGESIFIETPLEVLLLRCAAMTNRPLFRDVDSFRALYAYRLPFYRQAHHLVAAGEDPPQQVVDRILRIFA